MKKILSILLALMAAAGVGMYGAVNASAADDWPPPNARALTADVVKSENRTSSHVYFSFTPTETGTYALTFTPVSNSQKNPIIYNNVTLYDADGERLAFVLMAPANQATLKNTNLRADETYYYRAVTQGTMKSYTCLVTRTGKASWWFRAPGFVQWFLRYICFGWAWMKHGSMP